MKSNGGGGDRLGQQALDGRSAMVVAVVGYNRQGENGNGGKGNETAAASSICVKSRK